MEEDGTGRSLREEIRYQFRKSFARSGTGRFLTSSSTGSTSASWATDRTYSPGDVTRSWVYLLELYDIALANLGGSAADSAIVGEMRLLLEPIKEARSSWGGGCHL